MKDTDFSFLKSASELKPKVDQPHTLVGRFIFSTEEELKKWQNRVTHETSYQLRLFRDATYHNTVKFEITPKPNIRYASYEDAIYSYGLKEGIGNKLTECLWHQWAISKKITLGVLSEEKIEYFEYFIRLLCLIGFYNKNNTITFYSNKPIHVSLAISRTKVQKYLDCIFTISQKQILAINSLRKLFPLEISLDKQIHLDEKKKIFHSALDSFSEDINENLFIYIFENIDKLEREVTGQYSLYMENFQYDKFVKKLEENTQKYISGINDTTGKILSQILALPIAATALSLLSKEGLTWVGYLSLVIYSIICAIALYIQWIVLENLEDEVTNFAESKKLPKAIRDKWEMDYKKIDKIINWQKKLIFTMCITIILCFVFAFYNLYCALR